MNAIFRRFYLKQDTTCKVTLYISFTRFVNDFFGFYSLLADMPNAVVAEYVSRHFIMWLRIEVTG